MTGHDPNKMDLEKRLLLAMLLSMAVLLITPHLYQTIFPPPPVTEESQEESKQVAAPTATPEARVQASPPQSETTTEWERTEAAPREITVENEHLTLRWTTAGGGLQSVLLKNYRAVKRGKVIKEGSLEY
jgi:YidC/Oxa1 family membrane protein insertase